MITAMLNSDELKQSVLIVVIESGNLRRMELGDPATLESVNNGGILMPPMFPANFNVLIAYDDDEKTLYAMAKGPPDEFLRYLERGRRFYKEVDGLENVTAIHHGPTDEEPQPEATDSMGRSPKAEKSH